MGSPTTPRPPPGLRDAGRLMQSNLRNWSRPSTKRAGVPSSSCNGVQRWRGIRRIRRPKTTEREFVPVDADRARSWMLEGEVQVFRNPFGDPPEAAAEPVPGATIFIRVPTALKSAVDTAARAQKLSGNVWAMRCLERCLEKPSLLGANDAASLVRKLVEGDADRAPGSKGQKNFGWPFSTRTRSSRLRRWRRSLAMRRAPSNAYSRGGSLQES